MSLKEAVPVDSLKRYQRYFKHLLKWERDEEMEFHRNEIMSLSGPAREKKGRAVQYLDGKPAGRGLGGIWLIRLLKRDKLPETEINPGDLVIVSTGNPTGKEPQATVIEKSRFSFTIAYNQEPPGYLYKGRLRVDLFANDISFQRMQEALFSLTEELPLSKYLLNIKRPVFQDDPGETTWIQENLNDSQKEAVKRSIETQNLFLIHGPPGTGKTTTLVESIIQHVKAGKTVLATADSNNAVDNMVEKLIDQKVDVLRLGNPARLNPQITAVALEYRVQDEEDYVQAQTLRNEASRLREEQKDLTRPTAQTRRGLSDDQILKAEKRGMSARGVPYRRIHKMAEWIHSQRMINVLMDEARVLERKAVRTLIKNSQVICSTNVSVGSDQLKNMEFDVVFVDEATQAMEPSCLIPMRKSEKWILAGDHKQLPPTVLSKEAHDLNYTLFERWMDFYEVEASSMLSIQYRMNKKIMGFSNNEFYNGRLKASPKVSNWTLRDLSGFSVGFNDQGPISNPDIPMVFVDVPDGVESKLKDSFSLFNLQEIAKVEEITNQFMMMRMFPSDIGVISPYEQQVNRLKDKLGNRGFEIKTIDGFQGREKEVIVVSFVRSNSEGNLGFLTDYRRLNVALTRAKKKLILIGNKDTLSQNKVYKRLLDSIE